MKEKHFWNTEEKQISNNCQYFALHKLLCYLSGIYETLHKYYYFFFFWIPKIYLMQFSRLHNRNPLRITLKGGKSGELKWIWYIIHHTYICGTEQYYTADIWPNSHRGGVGCFSHTVQNDRNALPKRKSFVWTFVRVCAYVCICKWVCVCVCVCVNVYNVHACNLNFITIRNQTTTTTTTTTVRQPPPPIGTTQSTIYTYVTWVRIFRTYTYY